MLLLQLEWDNGNWPKCGKHGISKEAIEAFFALRPSVKTDPNATESRLRAIGQTGEGRYMFVVFTLRRRDGVTYIRPVSARYMHRKEVSRYEKDSLEAVAGIRH